MTTQQVVNLGIRDVAYNGIEIDGKLLVAPPHVVTEAIATAMNRYPRPNSLGVRYLVPIVRRLLDPPPGPGWYFGLMEEYRKAKRFRPALLCVGSDLPRTHSLSPGYGWHRLELWALTAYLASEDNPRYGTIDLRHDRTRLRLLVKYATQRLQTLVNRTPSERRSASDFEELCGPLRRFLVWNAVNPTASHESRVFCSGQLKQLNDAILPRLSKRPSVHLNSAHRHLYNLVLQAVREVWKDTHGDQTDEIRKQALLGKIPWLIPTRQDPLGNRIREALWNSVGDLMTTQPHTFVTEFFRHMLGVRLSPQRFREVLGKTSALIPEREPNAVPYAVESSRRRGSARNRVTRIMPIDFV